MSSAFHSRGDELRFTLSSRGDLVRGRLVDRCDNPGRPLVIVGGPSGSADHPVIDRIIDTWTDWCAVAAIDLPLCGARSGEKLTELVFGPGTTLRDPFAADIEAQVAHDLRSTAQVLAERGASSGVKLAFVGLGLSAELARGFADAAEPFDLVSLAAAGDDAWLAETAARIRELA